MINSLFFLLFAATSQASVSVTTCQAFDSVGNPVSNPRSFTAQARMSRSLQITEDGILYIRWPFYTEPVEVILTKNPNYPFTWGTTELGRAEIAPGAAGVIDGEIDLGVFAEGFKLVCKQR